MGFLLPIALFSADNGRTASSYEEARVQRLIDSVRKNGFGDYEIDSLHKRIGENLGAIKGFTDKGYDKQNAKYLEDVVQKDIPDLFKVDSAGKKYLEFELERGESFADYPKTYLFNARVYVFIADDLSLEKVIIQYIRTNSRGENFIREMRRVINPTPKPALVAANGEVVADDNSDITLEYYTSNDGQSNWPNEPILANPPGLSIKLNEKENPIPYFKQRYVLEKYRRAIKQVDQAVAKRLYLLELDRKRMISKMVEFQ